MNTNSIEYDTWGNKRPLGQRIKGYIAVALAWAAVILLIIVMFFLHSFRWGYCN